ncbi:MAG: hypothetical protein WCF51_05280 [Nitrosomonadaceae bacterium]
MSTIIAMNVPTVMASTDMLWRAMRGIRRTDLENMLIHMIPMDMMQMSIVQVISVSGMVNGQVPTPGSMLVFVILMLLTATHMNPPMMVRETINLSIHKQK